MDKREREREEMDEGFIKGCETLEKGVKSMIEEKVKMGEKLTPQEKRILEDY